MMPAESSLEQGDGVLSCEGGWDQHSVQRNQERIEWSSSTVDAVLPPSRQVLPQANVASLSLERSSLRAPVGVRRDIERPPRT